MRVAILLAALLVFGCNPSSAPGLAGEWSALPRATVVYDGFGNRFDAVTVDLTEGPTLTDTRFERMTPLLVRAESSSQFVMLRPDEVPTGPVQINGKLVPKHLVFGRPTADSPSRTIARREMLRNGQPVYEYVLVVGKLEPSEVTTQ
ncbi:MAG: hypothetical protein AAGD32_07630 [Planctomycetota bacterium]